MYISFSKSTVVELILDQRAVKFPSTNTQKVRALLSALEIVIVNNIVGDVVELGCETGESSIYIRLMLNYYKQSNIREYHVYDSWKGVPEPQAPDLICCEPFTKGCCSCKMSTFVTKFENEGLLSPIIHSGWFADIPDRSYPNQIAFAYFDGDLYQSIIDSFSKTFNKVTANGLIVIDDYEYPRLPGCKKAVEDFLYDKIEKEVIINDYSDVGKGVLIVKGTCINYHAITYGTRDYYKDVSQQLDHYIGAKTFKEHFGDDIPGIKYLSFKINQSVISFSDDGKILVSNAAALNNIKLVYGAANYYTDVTKLLKDTNGQYVSLGSVFNDLLPRHNKTLRIYFNNLIFDISKNDYIENITNLINYKQQLFDIKTKLVAFNICHFSERGTSIAVYDYAHYNETILGNKSIILYQYNHPVSHPLMQAKFQERFRCFSYNNVQEIEQLITREGVHFLYNIIGVTTKLPMFKCINLTHAVFTNIQLHGDIYAGISEEISNTISPNIQTVPHMCALNYLECNPNQDNWRKELNIPLTDIVLGRHGGKNSFDGPYAKEAIIDIVNNYNHVWFLFLNTDKFIDHPRVIHFDATVSHYEKTKFIFTCDAMIHSFMMGESFGLAVAEFSVCNKPIITSTVGTSIMHIKILKELAIIYHNQETLKEHILNIKTIAKSRTSWNAYKAYNPYDVMQIFNKVFLTNNTI